MRAAGAGDEAAAALAERRPRPERYRRLFGHTARGPVPLYGGEYGDDTLFQQPQRLADLAGLLAAFGLRLAHRERPDHVCCQLELMAFLARKEAYAREGDAEGMVEEVTAAQRLVLSRHLGRFAPALGARLERADGGGFYGLIGGILQRFVLADCARFGVDPGPDDLVLRPDREDHLPMMCGGAAEELVQLGGGPSAGGGR
ncbi:MAG: hypothetical protein D6696_14400 [Acidobacteria bacterium]|nr:MAG: hypothetical protein D6696_14400 [Acidobacteriota bacterium]